MLICLCQYFAYGLLIMFVRRIADIKKETNVAGSVNDYIQTKLPDHYVLVIL